MFLPLKDSGYLVSLSSCLFLPLSPIFSSSHCFLFHTRNFLKIPTFRSTLNRAALFVAQLYRPPRISALARLVQIAWRFPGCLPVFPTPLTSTASSSGTGRKRERYRSSSLCSLPMKKIFCTRLDPHASLLRYHPIDDEDDITETSVVDGGNTVVLRRKWPQKLSLSYLILNCTFILSLLFSVFSLL